MLRQRRVKLEVTSTILLLTMVMIKRWISGVKTYDSVECLGVKKSILRMV